MMKNNEINKSAAVTRNAGACLSRELSFLASTFERCRIPVRTVTPEKFADFMKEEISSLGICDATDVEVPKIEGHTVYRLRDRFDRVFTIFETYKDGEMLDVSVGPYLTVETSEKHFYSVAERLHLSPSGAAELSKYISTLVTVADGSPINAMLSAFFERQWGVSGYTVIEIVDGKTVMAQTAEVIHTGGDNLLKMKAMERRYEFENALMDAVTRGRIDAEEMLVASFTPANLEQRVLDPIQNAKNYCIIMNTLLRKAAEAGGVHPLYLDEMSSANAGKIEALTSHLRAAELMSEMFRGYCRLVKRRAHKEYSPVVRRAVIMIDADLSADLSAGAIASALDVSLGYLSNVFKKEVGNTVSEYVRSRRMEYAASLLSSTGLQVQSVALAVGMVDLNYFTRLFKSHTGKTPTEYRKTGAKNNS